MTLLYAWSAALASAGVLALFLARLGLRGRLFLDALAIGATLGSTVALVLAPFALKTNPYHFSPVTLAFLFAGLPEEGIKLLGIAAFLRGHFRVRDRRDVTLAAGALALGFGGLENLFYLAQAGNDWAALALERALTAQPFHVLLGIAGGCAVARAPGVAWGLAIGAALAGTHGLYDYAVFADAGLPRAGMIGAEATAALAAALALRAAGVVAPQGRAARGLGWALAAALGGGALAGVLYGAVAGYALDSVGAFGDVVAFAVLPFALGALSAPAWRPLSRRGRRVAAGAALAALGLAAGAADVGWRKLDATRQETLGGRYAAAGDFGKAEKAFSRAIAEAPGEVEPLSQRAAAYAAARRYDAALADIDAALRVAPSAALYAQRADVDRRRNAPAAALADLDAAVALSPDDPALRPLRAQAKLEAGDAKGAYDDLAEASRRTPDAPLVRLILADWEVNAGDLDAALRELNARLHAAPDDGDAAFRRGRVWFYKGELAKADADFARASGLGFYPRLWRFLAQTRAHARADAALRTSLQSEPDWPAPVARMLLGDIDPVAAASQAADEGERCEADFYFAASRLGFDPSETSAGRLRAAMAECPTSFVEYEGAKALLRRLGF